VHAPEVSGLDLAGLEGVRGQLEEWLAVVRAEQARIMAGAQVRRRAWKNAIFAGPPGAGKSRAAAALARAYQELGALPFAGVYETAAAGLAGSSARETADLVHDAAQRGAGRVLLITGAHSWRRLPDGGAYVLRALYEELSEARHGLAVVLAGEPGPVAELMGLHPPLAARFPLTVSFPGYSGGQLGHVFAALAAEAGFTLDPAAAEKAAAVLAAAQDGQNGSGRLAVALLGYAAITQARRVGDGLADPLTITAADLPDRVELRGPAAEGPAPGLYL
jgi:hypothetical protein